MSVCCEGVVLTPTKDVFLIGSLVEHALDGLILAERNERYPVRSFQRFKEYQTCDVRLSIESRLIQVRFTFRGKQRMLCVFFDCDRDHKDLGPQSISVSMGANGHAGLYIRTVLHALSVLGPAYFQRNDDEDGGPVPLGFFKPTAMNLIAMRSYPASHVNNLVRAFDAGHFAPYTFEEVMGVEESWLRDKLSSKDISAAWAEIKERALSIPYPAVRYEDEELLRATV